MRIKGDQSKFQVVLRGIDGGELRWHNTDDLEEAKNVFNNWKPEVVIGKNELMIRSINGKRIKYYNGKDSYGRWDD